MKYGVEFVSQNGETLDIDLEFSTDKEELEWAAQEVVESYDHQIDYYIYEV